MDPTGSQVRFCTLLAGVVNIILLGNLPRKIAECFCDSQVIAIPKTNNDIRPINIICSLRQIVEKVAQNYLRKKWADHFGYTQLGLKCCGTEFIAHEFQIQFEKNLPNMDFFTIDADNAFNRVDRLQALRTIMEEFPEIFPLIRLLLYQHDSTAWFSNKDNIPIPIKVQSGFLQCDVLATFCYNAAIHPFVTDLHQFMIETQPEEEIPEQSRGAVRFYADDGNIYAEHSIMIKIIQYIKENGPKVGYFIKSNKGNYLLGKCDNHLIQHDRINTLSQLGVAESIIKTFPTVAIKRTMEFLSLVRLLVLPISFNHLLIKISPPKFKWLNH
jgi:hypothetical protein